MTVKVVDASALAALSFLEAKAADIASRIDGHELYAPNLIRLEMANVCLKKIRAQHQQRNLLLAQHAQSQNMRIRLRTPDLGGVLALAEQFRLSAYDASYLWLAKALGAELVTLDERLEKAAAKP